MRLLISLLLTLCLLLACSKKADERERISGGSGGSGEPGEVTDVQQADGRAYLPARDQCFGIIDGVKTSAHPSVVLLGQTDSSGDQIIGRCTGTFVSSNTVITAAHCIDSSPTGSMVALIDDCSAAKTWLIPATKAFHHGITQADIEAILEKVNEGGDSSDLAKDLAVLLFPDDTSSSTSSLSDKDAAVGDSVVMVGYGIDYAEDQASTGDGDSFETVTKREGKNSLTAESITFAEDEHSITVFHDRTIAASKSPGTYSAIASGDSGGPLFINSKLSGVTSTGAVAEYQGDTFDIGVFIDIRSEESRYLLQLAKDGGASFEGWDSYFSQ